MARPYRRLIRAAAIAFATLILLMAVAVGMLVLFVDADTFRPRIEGIASAQLGRNVSLGHLEWDLGWRLGLATEGGSIANAAGFEGATIASWKRIEFGLGLRALLRRQVQVDHLEVDGLALDLQKDRGGAANWELPESPAEATEGTTSIGIESVSLANARVRFRDAGTGADWRVESLTLEVELPGGKLELIESLRDLRVTGQLYGGPLDAEGAKFSFDAELLRFNREETAVSCRSSASLRPATLEGALEGGLGAQGGEAHAKADIKLAVPSLRTHSRGWEYRCRQCVIRQRWVRCRCRRMSSTRQAPSRSKTLQ